MLWYLVEELEFELEEEASIKSRKFFSFSLSKRGFIRFALMI